MVQLVKRLTKDIVESMKRGENWTIEVRRYLEDLPDEERPGVLKCEDRGLGRVVFSRHPPDPVAAGNWYLHGERRK